MSLQFVIDGYNIINHPAFSQKCNKIRPSPEALLKLIKINRPCGKNNAIVVFDGYPPQDFYAQADNVEVIFSREESADDKIKRIVESYGNRKIIVVVSDDNEVKFFARSSGAKAMSAEEFLNPESKSRSRKENMAESKLSYSQMHKINEELKKIWLR